MSFVANWKRGFVLSHWSINTSIFSSNYSFISGDYMGICFFFLPYNFGIHHVTWSINDFWTMATSWIINKTKIVLSLKTNPSQSSKISTYQDLLVNKVTKFCHVHVRRVGELSGIIHFHIKHIFESSDVAHILMIVFMMERTSQIRQWVLKMRDNILRCMVQIIRWHTARQTTFKVKSD